MEIIEDVYNKAPLSALCDMIRTHVKAAHKHNNNTEISLLDEGTHEHNVATVRVALSEIGIVNRVLQERIKSPRPLHWAGRSVWTAIGLGFALGVLVAWLLYRL